MPTASAVLGDFDFRHTHLRRPWWQSRRHTPRPPRGRGTRSRGPAAARKAWRRYPSDPETDRMDIETPRVHRIDTNPAANVGAGLWYTYHAMTWTVSGTISNSSGGTVDLMLFDAADDTLLRQDSRTGNGAYSFTWYQDTREVYVAAYESGTLTGCSARGYPS